MLEIKPAVDNSQGSAIWSLRFSGTKRGCFGILSNTGEVKVVEIAQHSAKQLTGAPIANPYGGSSWQHRHYTRQTHNLKYPWNDDWNGEKENTRIIAYDFMKNSGFGNGCGALALHANRDIEFLKIPEVTPKINLTSLDELSIIGEQSRFFSPRFLHPTTADELKDIQQKAESGASSQVLPINGSTDRNSRMEKLSLDASSPKGSVNGRNDQASSEELHDELLSLSFPTYKPTVGEMLRLLRTQQRRCNEGYLFDHNRNKTIVSNDPWLVDMWDTLKRFEEMAKGSGMRTSSLIFDFLGVHAIWNNTFGTKYRNRSSHKSIPDENAMKEAIVTITQHKGYPPYRGIKTAHPTHRQLCLALCGWTFSKERLRAHCTALMEQGQFYKAIVIAVFRGFKDLALDLLKTAIQSKQLSNIGLAAVIACETVTNEQRDLCSWMASETDDAYLRALLSYFTSGDWKIVAEMPQLALSDRIGVALKYVDDSRLSEFIATETSQAVASGNIEGLVLTGLGDKTLDLFTHYIAKFSDMQTAVLAMSFVCPVYLSDARFDLWRELYFLQMQAWRAFPERAKYIAAHGEMSVAPDGSRIGTVAPNQPQLACSYCHKSLAMRQTTAAADGSDTLLTAPAPKRAFTKSPAARSGLVCPSCGHRMPSCGICGMLLGSPDPRAMPQQALQKLAGDDPLARLVLYCFRCEHAFHGSHAREWFAKHRMCPVPECRCMCGLLH